MKVKKAKRGYKQLLNEGKEITNVKKPINQPRPNCEPKPQEDEKLKCEDYQPCFLKDEDGYCMNNERSCIWREGACDDEED